MENSAEQQSDRFESAITRRTLMALQTYRLHNGVRRPCVCEWCWYARVWLRFTDMLRGDRQGVTPQA